MGYVGVEGVGAFELGAAIRCNFLFSLYRNNSLN